MAARRALGAAREDEDEEEEEVNDGAEVKEVGSDLERDLEFLRRKICLGFMDLSSCFMAVVVVVEERES